MANVADFDRDTIPRQKARSRRNPALPALVDVHPARMERPTKSKRPVGGIFKRCFDLVVAATALVLTAPLLVLIAIAVRLESRGPSFFLQRRGGLRGRPFLVIKFRTMTSLDDGNVVNQAARSDNRVTTLGAFLRRTSLDELPQLINVVRGEMALVGPRPHAVAHDKEFAEIEPSYRRRQKARPGITGLAQVLGLRGPTATHEAVRDRVRVDLQYIDRWSPFLDVWIIVKTFVVVLGDRKAF